MTTPQHRLPPLCHVGRARRGSALARPHPRPWSTNRARRIARPPHLLPVSPPSVSHRPVALPVHLAASVSTILNRVPALTESYVPTLDPFFTLDPLSSPVPLSNPIPVPVLHCVLRKAVNVPELINLAPPPSRPSPPVPHFLPVPLASVSPQPDSPPPHLPPVSVVRTQPPSASRSRTLAAISSASSGKAVAQPQQPEPRVRADAGESNRLGVPQEAMRPSEVQTRRRPPPPAAPGSLSLSCSA